MAKTRVLPALLLLAAAAARAETILPSPDERSDDPPEMAGLRDRFIHEARPDPLRKGYEELFAEPWPDAGWHPFARFKPFEDVHKFNDALERRYFEPVPMSVAEQDKSVQMQVRLPEGQAGSLNVYVNEHRVLLSYAPAESTGKWRFYKRREQTLAIPESADPDTAKISREGDVLTITFHKRG